MPDGLWTFPVSVSHAQTSALVVSANRPAMISAIHRIDRLANTIGKCRPNNSNGSEKPGRSDWAIENNYSGEEIWRFKKDDVTWSCELRVDGERGIDAVIRRDGKLFISHRRVLRAQAERWALALRQVLERD